MKKLFILLLMAISATANATTVADNDTLTILKPKKVRIITGDSIQKVKVTPTKVKFCWLTLTM